MEASRPPDLGQHFSGGQVDHPCGVAPLDCQHIGHGSLGNKGKNGELMGAEKQQETTISKADSGVSGHESSVRTVMGSVVPTKEDQPGFPRYKLPGASTPLWSCGWGNDL